MNLKFTLSAMMVAAAAIGASAVDYTITPKIVEDGEYERTDVLVSSINVLDLDPDAGNGIKDVTTLVQNALNKLGGTEGYASGDATAKRINGGVLYFPAGVYRIKYMNIPRGVTIRGDWKKPEPGQPIEGTILAVTNYYKNRTDEYQGFIIMEPSTQVQEVAIWYEDQSATSPVPYPPTIVYGKQGSWGNDYCNVRNVTLVNSYVGLIFSERNGGGCPNINGLYGTALLKGVTMDNIADVGRFDHIDFSPRYWAGSGLANAADASRFIYDNATGFEMRRNDWSYCCNLSVEGYARGFWAKQSPEGMSGSTGTPNGHNYNFTFSDCRTGIYLTDTAYPGIMFTRVSTPGCEYGVEVLGEKGVSSYGNSLPSAQFQECDLEGMEYALLARDEAYEVLQTENCRFYGKVAVYGGEIISDNCRYDSDVVIGPSARCLLTANNIGGELKNYSLYECIVDPTPRAVPTMPEYPEELMDVPVTKPARSVLYNVTTYGAQGYRITESLDNASDAAPAIQAALDAAGGDGGGLVYIPAGHYRCNSELTIPTGVELRGASDLSSVPRGQGAILEVFCGEGNANGTPFISMAPNSGLRGVSINYPRQNDNIFVNGKVEPKAYPYAVRGNADCYIVNLGVRACYQGVDLFTNKCDRHYVDYLAGHAFKNVIHVGGNSDYGTISNIQFNTIVYAYGYEWKFGSWPNSMQNSNDNAKKDACYQQNYDELDFFVVGDCRHQNLYNNFLFGSSIGIHFIDEGNGGAQFYSLGNAVDGVVNTFVFEAAAEDCWMINSQLVALNYGHDAHFFRTGPNFNRTINMFGTNNWGGGNYYARIESGTVNFICGNYHTSGAVKSWLMSGNGKCNIINAYFREAGANDANASQAVNVYSSIYTPKKSTAGDFGTYSNVLPYRWTINPPEGSLNRSEWHAVAFNDLKGQNSNGSENVGGDSRSSRAIDGNPDTRWSNGGAQKPYGWYDAEGNQYENFVEPPYITVYFNRLGTKDETVNHVVYDTSGSANDGPISWIFQVVDRENGVGGFPYIDLDGQEKYTDEPSRFGWRTVASGEKAGSILTIKFPTETTRGFRLCNKGGNKSNYWSVHEIYAMNIDDDMSGTTLTSVSDIDDNMIALQGRNLILATALFDGGNPRVNIYDAMGRRVFSSPATSTVMPLSSLGHGFFIVEVEGYTLRVGL